MVNFSSYPSLAACTSIHPTSFTHREALENAKKVNDVQRMNNPQAAPAEIFPLAHSLAVSERARFDARFRRSGGTVIGNSDPIEAISFRPQSSPRSAYPVRITTSLPDRYTVSDCLTACTSFVLTSTDQNKTQRDNSLYHSPPWAEYTPAVIREHNQAYGQQGWTTKAVVYKGHIDHASIKNEIHQAILKDRGLDEVPYEERRELPTYWNQQFAQAEADASSQTASNIAIAEGHHQRIVQTFQEEGIAVVKTIENINKNDIFGCSSFNKEVSGRIEIGFKVFADGRLE